jgi:hypothetical protein
MLYHFAPFCTILQHFGQRFVCFVFVSVLCFAHFCNAEARENSLCRARAAAAERCKRAREEVAEAMRQRFWNQTSDIVIL